MSDFDFNFDVEALPDAPDFTAIPAGDYIASIENAELRESKTGSSNYFSLELLILKPDYEGRKIWDNLVVKWNMPKKTKEERGPEQIGLARLKQYMQALGMVILKAPEELISGLVGIKVGIKEEKNTILKVYNYKTAPVTSPVKTKPVSKSDSGEVSPTSPAPKRASWAA